jgi:hypothetical protein
MAILESIQPYVEQLFDDDDVQKQLARARANLRGAQRRAGKAKSKKKALQDERLHARLVESARALAAAGAAIKAGPEKQKKRSRRGRVLVVLVLAAGAFFALNDEARGRVMSLLGQSSSPPPEG